MISYQAMIVQAFPYLGNILGRNARRSLHRCKCWAEMIGLLCVVHQKRGCLFPQVNIPGTIFNHDAVMVWAFLAVKDFGRLPVIRGYHPFRN